MSEQESGAEAASVGPFPSIGSERDPEATAAALADAVSAGWSCVVTVGVPLCSDGTNAWFGSGIYDPFSERTLLTPPEGLSAEGESDLRFAQAVAERLQALPTAGPGSVTFSLSIFDGKMVHGIGRAAARRMHSNITAHPEEFLPPPRWPCTTRWAGGSRSTSPSTTASSATVSWIGCAARCVRSFRPCPRGG
ncbi:hypothetical protein SSPO_022240 [Streptomyces antimycoticus]|uniref:Uncharacterized protein n=1 Tax=Streptomyces antimycoticus TaxID=68175 RepID=A0A499USJ6_9ACTN|nr:hypothetical protein [Streptomyces antimycoticus]BBJ39506.1 hypothetical protein SSPO_022240 [Streptomyces antimycoticus]